MGDQCGGRRSR